MHTTYDDTCLLINKLFFDRSTWVQFEQKTEIVSYMWRPCLRPLPPVRTGYTGRRTTGNLQHHRRLLPAVAGEVVVFNLARRKNSTRTYICIRLIIYMMYYYYNLDWKLHKNIIYYNWFVLNKALVVFPEEEWRLTALAVAPLPAVDTRRSSSSSSADPRL